MRFSVATVVAVFVLALSLAAPRASAAETKKVVTKSAQTVGANATHFGQPPNVPPENPPGPPEVKPPKPDKPPKSDKDGNPDDGNNGGGNDNKPPKP